MECGLMAILAQDSFTESGTGTANLSTHTAEVGGTWGGKIRISYNELLIDKDNDQYIIASGGSAGMNACQLGSGVLGDGDSFLSVPYEAYHAGPAVRISGTTFYFCQFTDNSDSSNLFWSVNRLTANVTTQLGTGNPASRGTTARMRLQVAGSSPTTLRYRQWEASGTEPGTWDYDSTDNTAGNQMASGGFGVTAQRSATLGSGIGDDYLVTDSSAGAGEPLARLLIGSKF